MVGNWGSRGVPRLPSLFMKLSTLFSLLLFVWSSALITKLSGIWSVHWLWLLLPIWLPLAVIDLILLVLLAMGIFGFLGAAVLLRMDNKFVEER